MEVYDKNLRYYPTMGDGLRSFPNTNVCGHLWRAVVTLVLHCACCGCGDTDHCYWGHAKLGRQAFSSCRSHQGCYYYYFDSANLNKQWHKRFSLISALRVNLGQIISKWINQVTVSSRDLPLTNKEPQPALGELGISLCLRWYRQGLMRKMLASHFQRNLTMKAREGLLALMLLVFFLKDQEELVGHEWCFLSHGCPWTPGTRLWGKPYQTKEQESRCSRRKRS